MKIIKHLIIGAGVTITPTVYYVYTKSESLMITPSEIKIDQTNK